MVPQHQGVPLHPHPHLTREALVPEQEEGEASCKGSGAQTWKFILSLRWLVHQEMTPSMTMAVGVKL